MCLNLVKYILKPSSFITVTLYQLFLVGFHKGKIKGRHDMSVTFETVSVWNGDHLNKAALVLEEQLSCGKQMTLRIRLRFSQPAVTAHFGFVGRSFKVNTNNFWVKPHNIHFLHNISKWFSSSEANQFCFSVHRIDLSSMSS